MRQLNQQGGKAAELECGRESGTGTRGGEVSAGGGRTGICLGLSVFTGFHIL